MGGGGSRRKARAVRPREAARAPAGPDTLRVRRSREPGGPGRPGQARGRVRRPPPRPTPSRGAESPGPAGAGRGCAWERTSSPRPPLRGRPSFSAPGAEARARGGRARVCAANEAGAQRRAAGAGVRRAAEEGRRLMNINRAAA